MTTLPTDDYMAKWAQPLWGAGGSNRDDLNAIRQMPGALKAAGCGGDILAGDIPTLTLHIL